MRFSFLFLLALCSMVTAAETETPPLAVEASDSQTNERERRLDDLVSTFEDVASALSAVEDMADADLVASRVAVDFLLLRDINAALEQVSAGGELSPDFARSFSARCASASRAVNDASARLREHHCYESDALSAALSLATLMDNPVGGTKLREAALELVANNLEMLVMLLDEVQDTDTADQVALLVMTSLTYDAELSLFAREQESHALDEEKYDYLTKRIEGVRLDFEDLLTLLAEKGFWGSSLLEKAVRGKGKMPAGSTPSPSLTPDE